MNRPQRTGMGRALQRPGFRRLFAAQTVSRWGDTFNSVALVILVYQLTGSGVKVAGTVAFAGPGPAFALNAATFLVSAAFLARLPIPERPPPVAAKHLDDVIEGLRAIRASRFLTVLAGVQGLAALSAGATSALLVVLAEEHLDVGAGQFGLLIAAIGIGAGFGPLVLQRVVDDVRRSVFLYGPYLLRGGVDVVLAAGALGITQGRTSS